MPPPPPPGVHVVCMLNFNIIISQKSVNHREEKYKRYKCGNSNNQYFSTTKCCQHQGPNSQRQKTLSQKPPVSLIYPLPRHINLQPQPLDSIYHLLLLLNLQPQLLRKLRFLFCIQTCLLLLLSLQPRLLSNACLLFSQQPCMFFPVSLHPCIFSNAHLLFSFQS